MRGYILMPVSDGKYFTKISFDDMDLSLNHKWFLWRSPLNKIYPRRNRKVRVDNAGPKNIYLHSEIAKRLFGKIGKRLQVDHINRDPLDCRRENLRIATKSENAQNTLSKKKNCEFKGVHKRKSGSWKAVLKKESLGTYRSIEDAALAYDRRAIEVFGNNATTNQSLGLISPDDGRKLITSILGRGKARG